MAGPLSPSWFDSTASTRRNSTGSQYSNSRLVGSRSFNSPEELSTLTASHKHLPPGKGDNVDLHTIHHDHSYDPNRPKLSIRKRLHHFTWAWYTLPMSTGGISLLIAAQPHKFSGLMSIGLGMYIFNILLFVSITSTMAMRFIFNKRDLRQSITHAREGFFFPTFFLAMATLITGTDRYVLPHDDIVPARIMQAFFWLYVGITFILAIGQYSYLFATHSFGLQTMMPTWILPIFPIMLSGTIASVISDLQPRVHAFPMVLTGLTCQGLGLSVALFMYAHMIGRLMQSGLPNREHRPGLFMCVGPPAFTALALIGMANSYPENFGTVGQLPLLNTEVLRNMAIVTAVFLWSLSLWWLGIGIVAVAVSPPKYFHLGWWASVFPNTGFTLASISIAKEFDSEPLLWATTGMSIIMVLAYCFVLAHHIKAVVVQDIMYPGRDEDVLE